MTNTDPQLLLAGMSKRKEGMQTTLVVFETRCICCRFIEIVYVAT